MLARDATHERRQHLVDNGLRETKRAVREAGHARGDKDGRLRVAKGPRQFDQRGVVRRKRLATAPVVDLRAAALHFRVVRAEIYDDDIPRLPHKLAEDFAMPVGVGMDLLQRGAARPQIDHLKFVPEQPLHQCREVVR
eukprot:7284361-Prymnesium_polylepis.1